MLSGAANKVEPDNVKLPYAPSPQRTSVGYLSHQDFNLFKSSRIRFMSTYSESNISPLACNLHRDLYLSHTCPLSEQHLAKDRIIPILIETILTARMLYIMDTIWKCNHDLNNILMLITGTDCLCYVTTDIFSLRGNCVCGSYALKNGYDSRIVQ